MLCWQVIDMFGLELDLLRVFKYALAHDIVEVYAGDTDPWNSAAVNIKKQREHDSYIQLQEQFGHSDWVRSIEKYETKEDKEAVFVYAMDKILPGFVCLLDREGRAYKKHDVGLEELKKHHSKAHIDPTAKYLSDEMIQFASEHPECFPKK
ncbi:MAG: HD domain-containing protein [Candidatus Peribacteria bacterium]|nr:MAG: HD domain-containing protein [Candidatus Peribacteria bacterium]